MTSRTGSGGFGSAGFPATAAAANGGGSAGVSNSAGNVLAPAVTTVTTTMALVQKRLSTVIRVPLCGRRRPFTDGSIAAHLRPRRGAGLTFLWGQAVITRLCTTTMRG